MLASDCDVGDPSRSVGCGTGDFVCDPIDPAEMLARVDAVMARMQLVDHLDDAETMLFTLARMVEAKDVNTGDHCSRLAHNAVVLGMRMGLGGDDLRALQRGGVLHDIGKLGIPDSILLKPGKLTDVEWIIMRQHVEIGARIVGGLRSMERTVPIILYHHEKWDGSGYPHGLAREQIPLLARIFQTVDIHDALAHERPYKKPFAAHAIVEIMEREVAMGWRDPLVTGIFLKLLKDTPQLLSVNDPSSKPLLDKLQ